MQPWMVSRGMAVEKNTARLQATSGLKEDWENMLKPLWF